jgi:hypothetical protein
MLVSSKSDAIIKNLITEKVKKEEEKFSETIEKKTLKKKIGIHGRIMLRGRGKGMYSD